jgi:drug/metabolite transporter (DMT)-like permease
MRNLRPGLVLALLASLAFGLYPVFLRNAFAAGALPMAALLCATWVRLALLLVLSRNAWGTLFQGTRRARLEVAFGGLGEACLTAGVFIALATIPAAIVSTAIAAASLPVAAWEVLRRLRQPTLALGVSLALGVLGVVLVTGVARGGADPLSTTATGWIALTVAVSGMLLAAAVSVRRLRHYTAPQVGAEAFLVVAPVVTVLVGTQAVPELPTLMLGLPWYLAALAALCVGTVVTYYGMARNDILQWRVLTKLQPVAALAAGAWVGADHLAWPEVCGVFLVVGSVLLYQRGPGRDVKGILPAIPLPASPR